MPATQRRLDASPLPATVWPSAVSEADELDLLLEGEFGVSPARDLQNRLQRELAGAAAVLPSPTPFSIAARVAIIGGLALSLWAAIGGVAALLLL